MRRVARAAVVRDSATAVQIVSLAMEDLPPRNSPPEAWLWADPATSGSRIPLTGASSCFVSRTSGTVRQQLREHSGSRERAVTSNAMAGPPRVARVGGHLCLALRALRFLSSRPKLLVLAPQPI